MLRLVSNFHPSFKEFFDSEIVKELENIDKEISKVEFAPEKSLILRFFQLDLNKIKILILGQDPYSSKNGNLLVATGRAYEVNGLNSFDSTFKQVSLKNFLRLIHKSLNNIDDYDQIISYEQLKREIHNGNFKINSPKKWFDSLEKQGVVFLNTSLTVEISKPLSHEKLWLNFTSKLLRYISLKNPHIIYFVWGKSSSKMLPYIKGTIFKSRHPMMCSFKYKDDFLKSDCILKTKSFIDWLGNV